MWTEKYRNNSETSYRLESFMEYLSIDQYTRSDRFSYRNPPLEEYIVCSPIETCESILTRYRKVGMYLEEFFEEDIPAVEDSGMDASFSSIYGR